MCYLCTFVYSHIYTYVWGDSPFPRLRACNSERRESLSLSVSPTPRLMTQRCNAPHCVWACGLDFHAVACCYCFAACELRLLSNERCSVSTCRSSRVLVAAWDQPREQTCGVVAPSLLSPGYAFQLHLEVDDAAWSKLESPTLQVACAQSGAGNSILPRLPTSLLRGALWV